MNFFKPFCDDFHFFSTFVYATATAQEQTITVKAILGAIQLALGYSVLIKSEKYYFFLLLKILYLQDLTSL
jgi:hypothetical protein